MKNMTLIAGPCVIESYEILEETAQELLRLTKYKAIDFYFKSSWKKDNRTKLQNYRGVSLRIAINYFSKLKEKYPTLKICTDFHNDFQVQMAEDFIKEYIDVIQIPAFLARQNSLLATVASTFNKKVHIKKPQFMDPVDIDQSINMLTNIGVSLNDIFVTDRGTCFGYDNLILDVRHIPIMKNYNTKVLVDITHPNKNYFDFHEQANKYSEILGLSSLISGADGLFLETHPNPPISQCDGLTMLPLKNMGKLIDYFLKTYMLRKQLDLEGISNKK